MLSDAEARSVLLQAFEARGLPPPQLSELQGVGAIGRLEGGYGSALGGINNWGMVQCKTRPPCPPGCAETTDKNAAGVAYQGCFRVYDSPLEGATDMLREIYRRPGTPEAMRAGDALAVAATMRAAGYFEASAAYYAKGIASNASHIAKVLGEPLKMTLKGATSPTSPATPRPSSSTSIVLPGLLAFGFLLLRFGNLKNHALRT
ncbi:MAG TPA: hypothetical protein VM487_12895 [Phycisphaerae bacterium]|nr:hypothetical protein [Phycisphaerae bacterium]